MLSDRTCPNVPVPGTCQWWRLNTYQLVQSDDKVTPDSAAQATVAELQYSVISALQYLTVFDQLTVDINLTKLQGETDVH